MDLSELDAKLSQNEKQNEVSNADVLASLVLIQSQLQKIEKLISENQKIGQKNYAEINDKLATFDKNISAIPVLTANIITDKTDKIVPRISEASDTFGKAITGLNQSNTVFKTLMQAWIASMALCFVLVLFLIFWR